MRQVIPALVLSFAAMSAQAASPGTAEDFRVVFDFKGLLKVPNVGVQLRQAMETAMQPQMRQQLKAAGVDLFTTLETVEMRGHLDANRPDPRHVVMLARGRFKKAAANKMLARDQKTLKAKKVGAHTLWLDPQGQGMVILDDRHLLAGHEIGMRAQMKRGLKTMPLPSFLRGAHLALHLGIPAAVRAQVRQRDPQNPTSDIEKVMARATMTSKRDLELKVQIRCTAPAAAQGLSMMVSMAVSNMTTQAPPPIARALRSLVLRPQGKVLGMSLALSEAELQALTTMAQQMASQQSGQRLPAAPPTKR